MADGANRKELALVKCKTVEIEVPAGSEVVIEGVVSTEFEPGGRSATGPVPTRGRR